VHVKQRMMVSVARFAPVTATAAASGVLVCEAVRAVLVDKDSRFSALSFRNL